MATKCKLERCIKNKAFTLVELIGVMVILSLILLVTVPSITKTLKNKKEEEYQRYLNDIYLATESYIGMRQEKYSELVYSNKAVVELQELIEAGYISSNKINPKTKEKVNPLETVEVTKTGDGTYSYALSGKENGFHSYITNGLLLWYDGKEHGENEYIWKDLSGNGKDGNLRYFEDNSSILWTENGLSFDGVNDSVKTEFSFAFQTPITIESTYIEYEPERATFAWNFASNTGNHEWYCYRIGGGYKGGSYYIGDNTATSGGTGTLEVLAVINGGILHNEAMLIEPSSKIIKIYQDGILKTEYTYTLDLKNNSTIDKLLLGTWLDRLSSQPTEKMNMKSFRVYNRLLTETEVQKNAEIDKMRFGI